jgi:hypothetical protein
MTKIGILKIVQPFNNPSNFRFYFIYCITFIYMNKPIIEYLEKI